jgi:hypothetical protein
MVAFAPSTIVASQQSDSATVTLTRTTGYTTYRGPLQIRVVSKPSAADGVNLPPVDRIVSFPADASTPFASTPRTTLAQAQAAYGASVQRETVTIPIVPGAANPGEVDVTLELRPVDGPPDLILSAPAVLQIKATSDVTPPTLTGSRMTSRGIELTFSEPLDPATAGDPRNYAVTDYTGASMPGNSTALDAITGGVLMIGTPFARKVKLPKPVRVRSAVYDPATRTVTLIPTHSLAHSTMVRVVGGSVADASGNLVDRDTGDGIFSATLSPGPRRARR